MGDIAGNRDITERPVNQLIACREFNGQVAC